MPEKVCIHVFACTLVIIISMLKSILGGLYIESKIMLKLVVDDNW